jgi:hypothetical protein
MGPRKLTHDAYTVGWVCVLRSELNASRALLDEEHERLQPGEKDDNSYLLGRMGKHNVVIAFPGLGTYGTSAATQTAINMVRTFRNIRFGLMVGVGGGAPKPSDPKDPIKDIRLGDVVVSGPKGNHGKHPSRVRVFHDVDSFLCLAVKFRIQWLIATKVVFFITIWANGKMMGNFTLNHI